MSNNIQITFFLLRYDLDIIKSRFNNQQIFFICDKDSKDVCFVQQIQGKKMAHQSYFVSKTISFNI